MVNKKAHELKAQPLKDFILGSSLSVNRKSLTHTLTNVNTHPNKCKHPPNHSKLLVDKV